MDTAKLFKGGLSQAVRLPKEFRFEGDEVMVTRLGAAVALLSKNDDRAVVFGLFTFRTHMRLSIVTESRIPHRMICHRESAERIRGVTLFSENPGLAACNDVIF